MQEVGIRCQDDARTKQAQGPSSPSLLSLPPLPPLSSRSPCLSLCLVVSTFIMILTSLPLLVSSSHCLVVSAIMIVVPPSLSTFLSSSFHLYSLEQETPDVIKTVAREGWEKEGEGERGEEKIGGWRREGRTWTEQAPLLDQERWFPALRGRKLQLEDLEAQETP
eukprot:516457-Hanusia_phi.AAC.2